MKKVTIKNANNHQFSADLILCFEVPEIEEKYIIYSFPGNDGDVVLNVGKINKSHDNNYYVDDLKNDAEWEFVKKVMLQIVKEK